MIEIIRVIKMGALFLDGQRQHMPWNPIWHGDIPIYKIGQKIEIKDSDQENIQWNVVNNMNRWSKCGTLLIADRILLCGVSWNDLHQAGFSDGVVIKLNDRAYRCHLLTVGKDADVANAWDDALNQYGDSNRFWHWNEMSFWGKDSALRSSFRVHRGCDSARTWDFDKPNFRSMNNGFRPALEPLQTIH